LILSLGPQFRLENFIYQRGDSHHQEFEHNHMTFLSTGSLLQPDMCVVFRSRASGWSKRLGVFEHERNWESRERVFLPELLLDREVMHTVLAQIPRAWLLGSSLATLWPGRSRQINRPEE
jgi:hypothetical protein